MLLVCVSGSGSPLTNKFIAMADERRLFSIHVRIYKQSGVPRKVL